MFTSIKRRYNSTNILKKNISNVKKIKKSPYIKIIRKLINRNEYNSLCSLNKYKSSLRYKTTSTRTLIMRRIAVKKPSLKQIIRWLPKKQNPELHMKKVVLLMMDF